MAEVTTQIATADARSITVLGRDLVGDVMGKLGFTEMIYLLATRRMPSAAEIRVLDACLVTLAEHGFNPSSVISRLLTDSVPGEIQVAMGAGLMAVGSVFAGTMEGCATLLSRGVSEGGDSDAWCRRVVAEHRAARRPVPGFGHATHKPDDPRTPRLLEIAAEAGMHGRFIALLLRLSAAVDEVYGRHLTINATGAMGALMLEIGLPAESLRGIAVVSRAAGLLGHVLEERQTHSARHAIDVLREHIPYEPPESA